MVARALAAVRHARTARVFLETTLEAFAESGVSIASKAKGGHCSSLTRSAYVRLPEGDDSAMERLSNRLREAGYELAWSRGERGRKSGLPSVAACRRTRVSVDVPAGGLGPFKATWMCLQKASADAAAEMEEFISSLEGLALGPLAPLREAGREFGPWTRADGRVGFVEGLVMDIGLERSSARDAKWLSWLEKMELSSLREGQGGAEPVEAQLDGGSAKPKARKAL